MTLYMVGVQSALIDRQLEQPGRTSGYLFVRLHTFAWKAIWDKTFRRRRAPLHRAPEPGLTLVALLGLGLGLAVTVCRAVLVSFLVLWVVLV